MAAYAVGSDACTSDISVRHFNSSSLRPTTSRNNTRLQHIVTIDKEHAGVTCMVHLWLIGKRMVDFLLVLIELFRQLSWLRRYEQILVEIVLFERGVGHFERKFQGEGYLSSNGRDTTDKLVNTGVGD